MWEWEEEEEGGDAAHGKGKKRTNKLQEWAQSQIPPKSLNMVRFKRALVKCPSKLLPSNGFIG